MTPNGVTLDSIVICDQTADQIAPSVSSGDSLSLVCWSDRRGLFSDIYYARVLRDGSVIKRNGSPINSDSMEQITPAVSYDGTNFLVVWAGYDINGYGIYGARISQQGEILDSIPICISRGSEAKYNPAVSFDGSNYIIIWDDTRITGIEYDEWAVRVSQEGILLDTNGIPVDTSGGNQFMPSIAYLNPYYLAIWTDDSGGTSDLFAKRISTSGAVIDSVAFPVCKEMGQQVEASCLAGSEKYLISWNDGRLGYENTDIYGNLVDTAGTGIEKKSHPVPYKEELSLTVSPNPFTSKTVIKWSLGISHSAFGKNPITNDQCPMTISIYDVSGRLVKRFTIDNSRFTEVVWEGRDDDGKSVPAGIYFCLFRKGRRNIRQKLVFIK